jgi:tetratricopeptide (TPR) repeat protein
MVARARAVAGVLAVVLAAPATIAAQGSDADRERAKSGVVMIEAKFPDMTTNSGAGIVIAADGQNVWVVTARHVISRAVGDTATSIKVMFEPRQGQWITAEPLDFRDTDLDIGAILVRLPAGLPAAQLKGIGIAPASSLLRGVDVYPLGYPQGNRWRLSPRPDTLLEAVAGRPTVVFQSSSLQPGNSGGPLLDGCGRVLGLVTQDASQEGHAIPIQAVVDTVRRWRFPPLLLELSASRCAAPANNATAISDVRKLHDQERWADSLPLLDRLINESPTLPELRALRAHAHAHLEDVPKALADGAEAVRLGPAVAEAYLRRGEARLADQKFPEALADFEAALKLDKSEPEIWANRGVALAMTGQEQKALDSLTQAITLRGDRYESWLFRGRIQHKLGNRAAAVEDFNQAQKLQPKNADIYLDRAMVHIETQQIEPALKDINEADQLRRDNPEVLTVRGAIYMRLQRWDDARKDLTYALSLRPGFGEATQLLQQLDAKAGPRPVNPSGGGVPGGTPSFVPNAAPPGNTAVTGPLAYARLMDEATRAIGSRRNAEANELVDQMIRLDDTRPEGWTFRGALAMNAFDNLAVARVAYQNALDRGGAIFFRVGHDHGTNLPPCFGTMQIERAGVTYAAEQGGHRFEWPLTAISEAALNGFYGMGIGMFHITAPDGRRSAAFNFAVVRATDTQVINRRPDAELLVGFVNSLRLSGR